MRKRRYSKRSKRLRKKYRMSVSAMLYYNELGRSLRGKAKCYMSDGVKMSSVKYDNVELEFFIDENDVSCFRDKNLNFYPNSCMRSECKNRNEFYNYLKALGVVGGIIRNYF